MWLVAQRLKALSHQIRHPFADHQHGRVDGRGHQVGHYDASATRRPSSPRTRPCWSTTAIGSVGGPILQVPDIWEKVTTSRIIQASSASSDARSASAGSSRSPSSSRRLWWPPVPAHDAPLGATAPVRWFGEVVVVQRRLHAGVGGSQPQLAAAGGTEQGQHHLGQVRAGVIECALVRHFQRLDSRHDEGGQAEVHVVAVCRARRGVTQSHAAPGRGQRPRNSRR